MEFLGEYALFLAKAVTVLVVVALMVAMAVGSRRRGREEGHRVVRALNDRFSQLRATLQQRVLPKKAFRKVAKTRKAEVKARAKRGERRKRVYVLNFKGDIRASAVLSLREEITAVLSLAEAADEIVVRLENAGGLVHEHGLAASQLLRIKSRGIPLTVAVDKVAASGGYMMACVAERIVAAPFAILGSIGVLAQIPNFHRLLDSHGVDFEMIKAGELKRTLTMFGENTDEDRARLQEQIEDTHGMFKDFVAEHRPALDMEKVATGEHWHGVRAVDLALVDELRTSDDLLLEAAENADVYEVTYKHRKEIGERLAGMLNRLQWWSLR